MTDGRPGKRPRESLIGWRRSVARRWRAAVRFRSPAARPADGLPKVNLREQQRIREGLAAVEAAVAAGGLSEARQRIDDLARELPASLHVRDVRAADLEMQGELSEPLGILLRINRSRPDDARLARERRLSALLVATTPGWLPRIPGPMRHPLPGRDLVLRLTDGQVTGSILERASPVDVGWTIETVDLSHLAFGAAYPHDQLADVRLEDEAWLAARAARPLAPTVLHVIPGDRGAAAGLVGLALRDHLCCPLVYEVGLLHEQPASEDENELAARRGTVETWLLGAADAVVVWTAEARDQAIGRGAAPARVTVVTPGAVDAAARLGDLYRSVRTRWEARDRGRAGAAGSGA